MACQIHPLGIRAERWIIGVGGGGIWIHPLRNRVERWIIGVGGGGMLDSSTQEQS